MYFTVISLKGLYSNCSEIVSFARESFWTSVTIDWAVVLSFFLSFQTRTCMGLIWYRWPSLNWGMYCSQMSTWIVPVLSANALFASFSYFLVIVSVWPTWMAFPQKDNNVSLTAMFLDMLSGNCGRLHLLFVPLDEKLDLHIQQMWCKYKGNATFDHVCSHLLLRAKSHVR